MLNREQFIVDFKATLARLEARAKILEAKSKEKAGSLADDASARLNELREVLERFATETAPDAAGDAWGAVKKKWAEVEASWSETVDAESERLAARARDVLAGFEEGDSTESRG